MLANTRYAGKGPTAFSAIGHEGRSKLGAKTSVVVIIILIIAIRTINERELCVHLVGKGFIVNVERFVKLGIQVCRIVGTALSDLQEMVC